VKFGRQVPTFRGTCLLLLLHAHGKCYHIPELSTVGLPDILIPIYMLHSVIFQKVASLTVAYVVLTLQSAHTNQLSHKICHAFSIHLAKPQA
jgi:hypothetical protein